MEDLFACFAGRFSRVEPRRYAFAYVRGLLAPLERKNGWTLAEASGFKSPNGLQDFLQSPAWDPDLVRDGVRAFLVEHLAEDKGERWVPFVIEPAAGLTRAVLAFMLDAYDEDEDEAPNTKGGVDKRTVMRFDPRLAPVKVAVLPLSRNEQLSPKAKELATNLRKRWIVEFDDAQAIGRRYRRQDEIGTPFCVTVDFARSKTTR